jgi:hypothetical protein
MGRVAHADAEGIADSDAGAGGLQLDRDDGSGGGLTLQTMRHKRGEVEPLLRARA